MRLSENRVLAWIVLAACVLASVFGLGGASLAREHADVEEAFYEGADDRDAGHSMDAYLNRMFESARTMALEAQLHLGANNAAAGEILDGLSAYDPDADEDFGARGELYRNLRYSLADALYNEMYAAELTDAQRKDFKIAYDDFQGAAKFIDKDPYAEMAVDFNKAREQSFISKLACMIHGVGSLWEPN